ncbi:peptidoglycan-binding domain-containing protein [Patulibacter minatonensis]|uniref:peptidoglycan-binding domain-containing protein n=1 Tax=Patulibacter minatonensis TaxID=298163 RepID=UPI00047CA678|nr:peptidoglycan-binding domain-containing protein [Patulibacter minatonensis]
MSTSIHPRQTSRPWDARAATSPSAGAVLLQALRAVGTALVPGRAQDDMVPALAASDAQALLVRAGTLSAGHASGRWDRPTTDAVARFQRARHLPCTGVLDHRTADVLLGTPDRAA